MSKSDAKKRLFEQLRAVAREQFDHLHRERDIAVEKMQELGSREDAGACEILIGHLTQSDNEILRPLAASRLGEIGGTELAMQLVQLLDNADESLSILIIGILAQIGAPDSSSALISLLKDAVSDEVRRRSALALGKTGGDDAFEALMSTLETENDLRSRHHIIEALGWLGDERCIPDLVQIMQTDGDKETRTFATEALGRIGSDACFEPLLDTLQNRDYLPIVRYYAAHALGLLGNPDAIEPLRAIANDPSEHGWVAQMAGEALERFSS